MDATPEGSRASEWYVPRFGSLRLRTFIGLLFLPYTGMVLAFAVIGSVLAERLHGDRILAIMAIYFLGLGIGAHALDALGRQGTKPWGAVFTRLQLWLLALLALALAYGIAIVYMVRDVPSLWAIAILEGFFVFAYNLEWFGGRFHRDGWFALSWGGLPVLAGYVMQTNRLSVAAVVVACSMALVAMIEIRTSRPYKELKRRGGSLAEEEKALADRYETILKCVSLGTILLGAGLALGRVGW